MKGSPVIGAGGGNASLLNATVEAIDMNWGCIAVRCVVSVRPRKRG